MKELLDDLLRAEAEAGRLLAEGKTRAEHKRQQSRDDALAYRKTREAQVQRDEERHFAEARAQAEEDEARILAAADHEVSALERRLQERVDALSKQLCGKLLPGSN